MSEISYYDVLGVKPTCSLSEIQSAYKNLVKKHHPDKGGNIELIELINKAYAVLKDPLKRNEYDEIMKVKKRAGADFLKLRNQHREFTKLLDASNNPEIQEKAKMDFQKQMKDMDRQIGFSSEEAKKSIDPEIFKQKTVSLETQREQEDIEYTPERLWNHGEKFDLEKFNAAFDLSKKDSDALILHDGAPMAFDGTLTEVSPFSTLDGNPGTSSAVYGTYNRDDTGTKTKITRETIKNINGASYTKGHTEKVPQKTLEQLMKEREEETRKLNAMTINEFNTDASMGGYGITNPIMGDLKAIEYGEINETDIDKKLDELLRK